MLGFLSSLTFFAPLSIGNYYEKNIHPQTGSDLAYRISELATEQISSLLLQCTLCIIQIEGKNI
jgi:hypothetical protein